MNHFCFQVLRLLAMLAVALAMLTIASCSDQPDVYTVQTKVTTEGTVYQVPRIVSVDRVRQEADAPGPKLRVDALVHDFGRMDPLTMGRHAFFIRNIGDKPLELEEGPTTCKCTLSSLDKHVVPPGDKARVILQWNSGRDPIYEHSATVFSNDPRQKIIKLSIRGRVRTLFRSAAKELVFSRVVPGQTPSASTVLYSDIWDTMEIEKVDAAREGVTCRIEPASDAEKVAWKARSACRLTVTLPPDLPQGYFTIPVVVRGRPANGSDANPIECELIVKGNVLRRIAVYGKDVDTSGTVTLGRVLQGQGAHVRLLLKVRDSEQQLVLRRSTCDPSFLNVRLEPYKTEGNQHGLYYLYVDLPKDAPPFRLPPTRRGSIHLEFDHPRIDALDLAVDVIVTRRS